MSATDNKWRTADFEENYSRQSKEQDQASEAASRRSEFDNLSQTAIIEENREKIRKLQLKSANYKQKEIKLKRDKDYLKKQLEKLESTVDKLEEHRCQDAESLLEQEERLSELKGRYRASENPNEIKKTKASITKFTKEESKLLKEAKGKLEVTSNNYSELAQLVPEMYENLRKLKFYGDKQMNEILLRQISIYVDQLQEKAKEYSKQKLTSLDDNKNLRIKLKQKYDEFEQLKEDTLEDYKQLFECNRKLNHYETDFIIDKEGIDKTTNLSQSLSQTDHSTTTFLENRGVAGEQNEVNNINLDILSRLRDRLQETEHKDDDIVKLIEKLPM